MNRKGGVDEEREQRSMDVAKRVLQWRWLIIDEISMVSAKLFATVDMKLRDVVRRIGTSKVDETNVDRPFGGLNVLVVGDFWQLDPPDGGFLADIPVQYIQRARRYQPAPTISHGQALFWSGPENGIQGVSELVEVERCKDAWLREVRSEIRGGALSPDQYNFLHGLPTSVPGSWVGGDVACQNERCRALALSSSPRALPVGPQRKRKGGAESGDIEAQACEVCRAQRESKRLVATARPLDPRYTAKRFLCAPAIFPNNDVKYDVNKKRAQLFADAAGVAVVYSQAMDTPSQDALRERPGLVAEKIKWLQRHDRESGDLYGMLPLIENMPVAVTDHIDRNPRIKLLRGKVGYVQSWILHKDERSQVEGNARVLDFLPMSSLSSIPMPAGRCRAYASPACTPFDRCEGLGIWTKDGNTRS